MNVVRTMIFIVRGKNRQEFYLSYVILTLYNRLTDYTDFSKTINRAKFGLIVRMFHL